MTRTVGTIHALAIATMLVASIVPANAASVGSSEAKLVAQRDYGGEPRFERHGNYALYNGHRGYRTRHPGYRQYNGYWFPPAAFVGAAIGGAIIDGLVNGPRGTPHRNSYDDDQRDYDRPNYDSPNGPDY